MQIDSCCKTVKNGRGVVASPFSRPLIVDYYDGLKSGYSECIICKTPYRIKMLDWDDFQDIRVFELRPLTTNPFAHDLHNGIEKVIQESTSVVWNLPEFSQLLHSLEECQDDRTQSILVIATISIEQTLLALERVAYSEETETKDWLAFWSLNEKIPKNE